MVQYIVCTIYFALHSLAYLVQYCFVLILKNLLIDFLSDPKNSTMYNT